MQQKGHIVQKQEVNYSGSQPYITNEISCSPNDNHFKFSNSPKLSRTFSIYGFICKETGKVLEQRGGFSALPQEGSNGYLYPIYNHISVKDLKEASAEVQDILIQTRLDELSSQKSWTNLIQSKNNSSDKQQTITF